jgi:Amidohydrolase family
VTSRGEPGPVVLRGVTVVDTRDGSLTPGVDVALADGRIAAITPTGDPGGSAAAMTIDAAGKFVVPGFLEMHTHVLGEKDTARDLKLLLDTGVTGFRLMGGSDKLLKERRDGTLPWSDETSDDTPALLAMPGAVLNPANAGTVKAALTTIREQHAAGADFIKAALVGSEVFFAAQAEARRLGLPIVGHLPAGIDVRLASKGGMRSIEHLGPGTGVLAGCSTEEAQIRAALNAGPGLKAPPFRIPFADKVMGPIIRRLVMNPVLHNSPLAVQMLRRAIDTFDQGRAEELAAAFVADGTWHCPTLIRERTSELSDAAEFRDDPNLSLMDDKTVSEWREAAGKFGALPADTRATYRDAYELQLRLTKLLDDAGVKLLAGSDSCGAVWEVPGYSLHQEFDELARAGLSPLRVLQTVTLDAAEFLSRAKTLGTVEEGKQADLVVLDQNPIESVDHLHGIAGVIRAGGYHSAAELN